MHYRWIRMLGVTLSLAAGACGSDPARESLGTEQAAVLGVDTHLYLLCNATSWDANASSRLVQTAPGSGLFTLNYQVTQDWMVSSSDSCSIVETNQLNGWGTEQQRYAFRAGQSTFVTVPDARALTPAQSSFFQAKYPAKGAFTATVNWHNGTFLIGATPGVSVVVHRSLFERNEAALTGFSVAQTLTRIAENAALPITGTVWHDNLFKTMARQETFPGEPGPFCNSGGVFPHLVNGFIVGCAGIASPLVGRLAQWKPLAVSNRFDLAPAGGENCGEARASFFMPPGVVTAPARAFMIFEAVVPNPQPNLGLDGCRAVQNFWQSLGSIADPAARGVKLTQAFLTGEPGLTAAGVKPFFTFENFGEHKGRVRTETFGVAGVVPGWDFREFRINADGSALHMPVAQSFAVTAFASSDHPKAAQCRQELLNTLGTLTPASPNLNFLGLDVSPTCFDGASGNFGNRPEELVALGVQPEFTAALQARAAVLAPAANLSAVQIAARVSFGGTCIGCHFRQDQAAQRNLGQGLVLPVVTPVGAESLDDVDFTMVNNLRQEPCAASGPDAAQNCFKLSPTLGAIFLPHRKSVLESYLNTPAGTFQPPPAGQRSALTIGGAPNARTH
jgi:hypothetical protein